MLKALIFDVDGTLADTESAHCAAFNQAFAQFGLGWHWDDTLYIELLKVTGGRERILHYIKTARPELSAFATLGFEASLKRLFELKTEAYVRSVHAGAVEMRPGVLELILQARAQGLVLAIATTTSPPNVAALLSRALGPRWREQFAAVGDGASARVKKPDPQVYLDVLQALQLPPTQCLAMEDSGNGLRAACAAGIPTVITPTRYTAHDNFDAALRVVKDLSQVDLAHLHRWHAQGQPVSCSTRDQPHDELTPFIRSRTAPDADGGYCSVM